MSVEIGGIMHFFFCDAQEKVGQVANAVSKPFATEPNSHTSTTKKHVSSQHVGSTHDIFFKKKMTNEY